LSLFDCAIIGAGPAGLSAAIQAKRQGLSIAVFEKDVCGGQVRAANLIENYPGIMEGISGIEFARRLVAQAKGHDVEVQKLDISKLSRSDGFFHIEACGRVTSSRTTIIAIGTRPLTLDVHGEGELLGKKIFAYISPEDVDCSGKRVLIIGGGDAAFDQALNFAKKASEVIVASRKKACAAPFLVRRVRDAGIKVRSGCEVASFEERDNSVATKFKDGEEHFADIVIECIGKTPALEFIDDSAKEAPGAFFAGDCIRGKARHVSIACGDGVAAAMAAAEFIRNK
jgi:thioredoxin reductase (NADPH)